MRFIEIERSRQGGSEPANPPAVEECHRFSWRTVAGITQGLPQGAIVVGQEADGAPLYAARVAYQGGVLPGKVRPGFGGANVGHEGREVTVNPFEVLVGTACWVPARNGQVPSGAPCGQEKDGTPLYLARARLHGGVHPGKLAAGRRGALIAYGGQEFEARTYEVLVGQPEQAEQAVAPPPDAAPLLRWDFDNTMSDRKISTSVGIPSEPGLISGFVSQTGGGPAEVWGDDTRTVFLTRQLGTFEVFLFFTVTRPVFLANMTFRHWHNHNPGYPTHPGYQVQLQLDSGEGPQNVGRPLSLSNENSGTTDTIAIDRILRTGSHKLRWLPRGLVRGHRDTNSEFFAMKDLCLVGHAVEGSLSANNSKAAGGETGIGTPPCAAAPAPLVDSSKAAGRPDVPPESRTTGKTRKGAGSAALRGSISLTFAGVTLKQMKVLQARYGGQCTRSQVIFEAGTLVAFTHLDELTEAQKAALFDNGQPTHVLVVLTPEEIAQSGIVADRPK